MARRVCASKSLDERSSVETATDSSRALVSVEAEAETRERGSPARGPDNIFDRATSSRSAYEYG